MILLPKHNAPYADPHFHSAYQHCEQKQLLDQARAFAENGDMGKAVSIYDEMVALIRSDQTDSGLCSVGIGGLLDEKAQCLLGIGQNFLSVQV